MCGEMVVATLADLKTQTRRLVKWDYPHSCAPEISREPDGKFRVFDAAGGEGDYYIDQPPCDYGLVGDRLWIKETFSAHGAFKESGRVIYRADIPDGKEPHGLHWKPSIFMPRKASRILLEIVHLRIERVKEIGEVDAQAEGCKLIEGNHRRHDGLDYVSEYASLWDRLNFKRGFGWEVNPWVWVITFKRITPNG